MSGQVLLRPADPGDVEAIAALEQEAFGADAWARRAVAEELTGPHRHVVVGSARGRDVVGYAVGLCSWEILDLQRIAVAPAYRRIGLARRLLAEVQRLGSRAGAVRMLLEVSADNSPALALYTSAGFRQIDRRERYYRDGSDALVLEAGLDPEER